jgi:hypothetical protein
LSPRISTTTIVMSLLMTMLSSFFRDSTSIGPILGGADPSPTDAANSLTVKVSSAASSNPTGRAANAKGRFRPVWRGPGRGEGAVRLNFVFPDPLDTLGGDGPRGVLP